MREPDVHIHYLRPPDRAEVFHQHRVHGDEHVIVTLAADVHFDPPVRVHGEVVLETGSDAVWFTFPGRWHDVGRFHRADGTFVGWYANVLTPPTIHDHGVWKTTDLFLDVWLPAGGDEPAVLDRDQFDHAVEAGWIDGPTRRRALEEVEAILDGHARGRWPPPVALEWTRERARKALGMGS
ncbi:MAG: DUF402 domain-containing protein [Gemmatimonadota bacterium]|jgi:predicted RNA-binding protein associated with RNAse of E/G family